MSIGILFGELATIAALSDAKSQFNNALSERSALAASLGNDLMVSRDTVHFTGRTEKKQVSDWASYFPQLAVLNNILKAIVAEIEKLEVQLDRFKRMREQDRVSEENAIAQGHVFY